MTTTCVKDSIVGDAWIQQTAASVPVQRILGEDGQPTGDLLTGPVRLAFANLFELPPVTEKMTNPKFGTVGLFTPFADFTIFYEEYYRVCAESHAKNWNGTEYVGLHSPFRDQREKSNYSGFTPGCTFMTFTSKFKPPVVDIRGNPIVDPSKVYAGVWAILSCNAYAYNDPRKKGVAFGLQSVMIIGDDTKQGGGAPDPTQQFAKVNVSAPIVRPDIAGHMPQGGTPPGAPGRLPMPSGAPAVPQQQWTPPQAGPAAPPPYSPPVDDDDDMSFLN